MVGEEFLPLLRGLAGPDGRLPRWTDWWDEPDVAALFPDPATGEAIASEQPRLPLAYYEEQVPVPGGWQDHRCAYLLFGPPYDTQAREARQRGWEVATLPGGEIAVRNSRFPGGPVLVYTRAEIAAFLAGAKDGEFDHVLSSPL